ncbi:hypothetical protein AMK27_02490 [Streptomyces sp. CB02009]|uniref:hypothetical protein n=1 Tax=Streptomyces sp. CB02009 TaxID=1703938 RepID=UPI000959C064|nr:hypothetical protein [Streptomyces sp. CB02009]OKJ64771.1 hypothetical protein AMK27_02490 [Streptomyces sp. CB02009]
MKPAVDQAAGDGRVRGVGWSQRSFGKLDEYASFRSLLDRLPSTLAESAAQSIDTLDPGGLE